MACSIVHDTPSSSSSQNIVSSDRDLLSLMNANLTAFIAQQNVVNRDNSLKLDIIHNLTRLVEAHEGRISKLEADITLLLRQNTEMAHELRSLKSGVVSAQSTPAHPSEIIISGLPLTVTDHPRVIATKVLDALGVPDMVSDILDVRSVASKIRSSEGQNSVTTDPLRPVITTSKKSLILRLKSRIVGDYIINRKRAKKDLTLKEAFDFDTPGSVYVNEFLPSTIYNLLRKTKARAKANKFEQVWMREGVIYARKTEGHTPIIIATESDLTKI